MAEGFVKLRSYWSPEEANLAKLHLESHGISAELDNATFVATAWIDANAVGGVKLLVRDSDVEQAEQILTQSPVDTVHEATEGSDCRPNWEIEENLDDADSRDTQVLGGFHSLKRPIIWLFLGMMVVPTLLMLVGWISSLIR